jgi:hypothetical protein
MEHLQSLKYTRGSLKVIDQLLLPHELVWIEIPDVTAAWTVIRTMQVNLSLQSLNVDFVQLNIVRYTDKSI